MARTAFNLRVQFVDVYCHEEADGPGDAEPYIWPVFFKIDGDTFAVDAVGLIGFPTVESTTGEHGNLDDDDVGDGDRVFIPGATGIWNTLLKPIPVNDPFIQSQIGVDLPGIAGAVVVLMEEDGWPDDIATTGYNALVDAVHLGVAKAAASFQNATAPPTPEEIDEQIEIVKGAIGTAVAGAVQEFMSGAQVAWYGTFGNNDDKIGSEAWTVTGDDFSSTVSTIAFTRRWDEDESGGDGDWTINGIFTNLDAPPPDNTSRCEQIAEQLQELADELETVTDINERKRILRAMGQLRSEARRLGC